MHLASNSGFDSLLLNKESLIHYIYGNYRCKKGINNYYAISGHYKSICRPQDVQIIGLSHVERWKAYNTGLEHCLLWRERKLCGFFKLNLSIKLIDYLCANWCHGNVYDSTRHWENGSSMKRNTFNGKLHGSHHGHLWHCTVAMDWLPSNTNEPQLW